MRHEEAVARYLAGMSTGVEIGAFLTPIPGISPIHVEKFESYANVKCKADLFGEATDLPFNDGTLDYVASSHVLEHVANPVAALREWTRVLRHQGIIYLVVPDSRYTWDIGRKVTAVEHMLEDYRRGVTASDSTHIDDFVFNVDWSTFAPDLPPERVPEEQRAAAERYHASVKANLEINIHFHVFRPDSVRELLFRASESGYLYGEIEVVEIAERFPEGNPNGILAVARVKKPFLSRFFRKEKPLLKDTFRHFPGGRYDPSIGDRGSVRPTRRS
ncbi:MAG: class I SAM-dependent methyltransferase [Opitutaceae bacterium]|nr:class I SAM-dependent methyltransferase [Opitutaceae bacterium]